MRISGRYGRAASGCRKTRSSRSKRSVGCRFVVPWIRTLAVRADVDTALFLPAEALDRTPESGGLQAAMKRSVALSKRARRQAGRGLMQRTDTWRTVRLVGARFR